MLQMKAQVEETQLKNRELLRQLAVARARAVQQQTPRQPRPSPTPSRSSHVSSRFSTAPASSGRQARQLGASRQPQAKDTLFPTPFRSSASHYGPSDDEDDAKSARRGRSQAQTRPAFRRFDPTAYQEEKERKLRAARARSNSRSRPPRSNGGYTSDSSAGGYSSAESRGSKGSARSTRSRGRAASRTSVERQREVDARLASPKKSVAPSPVETRRPRAANKTPLPRSGVPRSRSQSRGRSPSPAPSLTSNGRSPVGVREPSAARSAGPKPRQTAPVTRRRKPLPQELLDTSVDSFSDIDDRLTALQQFLREAKQGGAAAGTAA
ncbi:hypothetical protein BBJ28_00006185 [Nothophytophthora sp. Chile5]|nr:hypothetical protein BBJ28_00006185 [Nothophytophthora sp. Chile5]